MSKFSNLEEKLGVAVSNHDWGRWWQTAEDVQIEVDLPDGTKAKQLNVIILTSSLSIRLNNEVLLTGPLFGIVHADECTWTVEQNKLLRIILPKANYSPTNIFLWTSLLKDAFPLNEEVLKVTMEKMELERMKVENPAYDFSKFKKLTNN